MELQFANWIYHGCGRNILWVKLAEMSGLPARKVAGYARGYANMEMFTVQKLAQGLGIKTSELVREVERWEHKPLTKPSLYGRGAHFRPAAEKPLVPETPPEPCLPKAPPLALVPPNTHSPMRGDTYNPTTWYVRPGGESHKQLRSIGV